MLIGKEKRMPLIFVLFLGIGVGSLLGWGLKETYKDNKPTTNADEKNFRKFKEFMDDCKATELEEIWSKTQKP
jgi:hypothetical protein